jgi:hypothetical protein
MLAFGAGRYTATGVLNGTEYSYIANGTIPGLPPGDPADPNKCVKYLGQLNSYVFLLLPDSTLAIIPFDKTNGLQLRHFKTQTGGP